MATSKITPDQYKVSEIKLSYHPKRKPSACPKISCSDEAFKVLLKMWDQDNIEFIEEFKVMVLNRSNRVIGIVNLASGGLSSVVVDAKIIFAVALKASATGIILAHNHPSHNLKPSMADIALTKKVKRIGELLDLAVLDHLILTPHAYYFFADEGGL